MPLTKLTQRLEFRLILMLAFSIGLSSNRLLIAQNPEKFSFSSWSNGLTSTEFANSRFLMKARAFRQTSDDKAGIGEIVATFRYEILRGQDYCRILEASEEKSGIKTVVEQCFTKQFLHLQGNNASDPKLEPELTTSGCLDVRTAGFHPADLLGATSLIFGIASFSGDWRPRLAEFPEDNYQDPAVKDFGPVGTVRVFFTNSVPSEIEHSFESITRDKTTRRINLIDRNKSETNVIRYSKIVWKAVPNGFIPMSYTYDQYLVSGGERQSLQCQIVTIEEFDLDMSLSDSNFLPKNELAIGTPISVNEVMFACEWRDNRIQPVNRN